MQVETMFTVSNNEDLITIPAFKVYQDDNEDLITIPAFKV